MQHDHKGDIYGVSVALGVGFGMAFASMSNLIVAAVPPEQTGVASGMNANIRTIGGSLGAAFMASIVTSGAAPSGLPREAGYTHGFFMLGAALLLSALAAILIPTAPRGKARRPEPDNRAGSCRTRAGRRRNSGRRRARMTTLRSDAVRNRQRLLEAAETVFAEHGLEAGVEEIARAAGVGVGTLYRRFPTKDALIGELVRDLLSEIRELAVTSIDDPDGLERFLYATAAAQATHRGCLARLWDDAQTAQLKTAVRAAAAKLLAQAQANGRVRPDATLADLDLVFWSLRGIIEAAGPHAVLWRRHLAIMIAGLRPDGQALSQPPISERRLRVIKRAADGADR